MADDSDAEFLKRLEESVAKPVSAGESAARGGLLGGTLGWGPSLAAGIDTATSYLPGVRRLAQQAQDPRFPALTDSNVSFAQRKAAYEQANREAHDANPKTFNVAEGIGGGLAGAAFPGSPAVAGALAGGVAGAGYDESGTVGGKIGSTLKGMGMGAAVGKLAGGLSKTAESAAESNAALVRRELAGPQIGSGAGAAEVRKGVYGMGDALNQEIKSVDGLPEAVKTGDRRAQAAIANKVISQRSSMNDEIYSHATAKSREGGFPMSAAVDPLIDLASKLRKSGQSAQAAEIEKIANGNVRVDMFSNGTVADPRDVRQFITSELQGKSGSNLTLAEKDTVAAREKAAMVMKDSLHKWVKDNAGEEAFKRLETNNKTITAMARVADAATEGGYVQEMGTQKAKQPGVMGAVKDMTAGAEATGTRLSDTPWGKGLLWTAAKASKALPAPLLDAMATKDPDVAKKAIADDLFGGTP